jgi:hypothetical protein
METALEQILISSNKTCMISYMAAHPGDFDEVIRLAISDKKRYSWRAAWLLWSCMEKNDKRIKRYVKNIIDTISYKADNHQRELLIVLLQMDINEEDEGLLYHHCLRLWEDISKKPSIRYNAFKMILKIVKKHPDLHHEIKILTHSLYMNSLSPGVKRGIAKMAKDFIQKEKQMHT